MKTAQEWRDWYYLTHGHPVPPASLLDDILRDYEAVEQANAVLTLRVATGVEWEAQP